MGSKVAVIGGGPAGLAAAAMLAKRGLPPVVLDKDTEVGASWMRHYDRLHLHTARSFSGLPGLRIPRREGQWVSRDGVVRYLRSYARHFELDIRHGTEVKAVERPNGGWLAKTSEGEHHAEAIVVATGYNKEPVFPHWSGSESFAGSVIHASAYKEPSRYAGSAVLVVGSGNTGAEIAVDLADGGATKVWLSVRRGPHVMRRSVLGTPTTTTGIVMRRLPERAVNAIGGFISKITVGDLTRYGMPKPDKGLYTRVKEDDAIPILDVGLIDALRSGRVEVVAAVESFDGPDVVLADGNRISPQHVIAATGYRRGLEDLVPDELIGPNGRPVVHGPKTHPGAPRLHFIGYTNPISGNLRELGIDARRIARALAKELP